MRDARGLRGVRVAAPAVAALVLLAGCGSGGAAADRVPAPPASLGAVVHFTIPPAISHLPLTKPDGTTTTLAAYAGQPVLITDYLTNCTDICPLVTANVVALARALAADGLRGKVALLEVTVDPHRDTPARMRAYQRLFRGPVPDWTLLRASPADTKRLWRFFGVAFQRVKEQRPPSKDWLTGKPLTYDIDHSDDLIFLDAAGDERFAVNAEPNSLNNLPPRRLVRTLTAQGRRNLRHPNPVTSWTVSQGLRVFSWLTNRHLAAPQG